MRKKMRRLAAAVLSVVLCLSLTGCYRIHETITVGSDGSVVIALDEGIQKSTMDSLANLSNDVVEASTSGMTSNANNTGNMNGTGNASNANSSKAGNSSTSNTSTSSTSNASNSNKSSSKSSNTSSSSDSLASDYLAQSIQDYLSKGWDVSQYDDGEYVGAKVSYSIDDIRKVSTTTGTLDEWAGAAVEKTYSTTDDLSGYTPTNVKFFYHDTEADTYTFRVDVSSLNETMSAGNTTSTMESGSASSDSVTDEAANANTNSNSGTSASTNISTNTSTNSNTSTSTNTNSNSNAPATLPATSESVSALTTAVIDDFSLTLVLPQAPISSNATSVSDDGKTLTWSYDPDKGVITDSGVIECTFAIPPASVNWTTILLGGGAAALVVLIIVLVAVMIAHKRRNQRKQMLPEEWLRGEVEPAKVPDEPAEELLEEIAEIKPADAESTEGTDSPADTAPMRPIAGD